jgi:hydroxyethylthiazole kinase
MFSLGALLSKIRDEKPLVHHITNYVTAADCAAATRNIGALPVMAHSREEVCEMVQTAGSLVINTGTLTSSSVEAMLKAGMVAYNNKIPVILDPVGAGATKLRTETARLLLERVSPAIIKGNAAEIALLSGLEGEIKGVESIAGASPHRAAGKLAKETRALVVVTGREDIITDGEKTALIKNGHPLMGLVVGTGCMVSSLLGAFAAVETDYFQAAAAALAGFGVAGELAATKITAETGPLAYKTLLLDQLYLLREGELERRACVDFF